jgi:hypothetical protein
MSGGWKQAKLAGELLSMKGFKATALDGAITP